MPCCGKTYSCLHPSLYITMSSKQFAKPTHFQLYTTFTYTSVNFFCLSGFLFFILHVYSVGKLSNYTDSVSFLTYVLACFFTFLTKLKTIFATRKDSTEEKRTRRPNSGCFSSVPSFIIFFCFLHHDAPTK